MVRLEPLCSAAQRSQCRNGDVVRCHAMPRRRKRRRSMTELGLLAWSCNS